MKVRDLANLGPKSEAVLVEIGITSVDEFLSADVFELYRRLTETQKTTSLNMLYAMIGAQEGVDWKVIKSERKTEILMRLDDMGIAK